MELLEKFQVGQPVIHRYLGDMKIIRIHQDPGFPDSAHVLFKNDDEIFVSVEDLSAKP